MVNAFEKMYVTRFDPKSSAKQIKETYLQLLFECIQVFDKYLNWLSINLILHTSVEVSGRLNILLQSFFELSPSIVPACELLPPGLCSLQKSLAISSGSVHCLFNLRKHLWHEMQKVAG